MTISKLPKVTPELIDAASKLIPKIYLKCINFGLEAAASRFLKDDSANVKYLGVKGLNLLVAIDPESVAECQSEVFRFFETTGSSVYLIYFFFQEYGVLKTLFKKFEYDFSNLFSLLRFLSV